jgi:hypothetical protein
LKNFIGTLTLNDKSFANIKRNYAFYDMLEKDIFKDSAKSLKIASSCYDLIYMQNNQNPTPKHCEFLHYSVINHNFFI